MLILLLFLRLTIRLNMHLIVFEVFVFLDPIMFVFGSIFGFLRLIVFSSLFLIVPDRAHPIDFNFSVEHTDFLTTLKPDFYVSDGSSYTTFFPTMSAIVSASSFIDIVDVSSAML